MLACTPGESKSGSPSKWGGEPDQQWNVIRDRILGILDILGILVGKSKALLLF